MDIDKPLDDLTTSKRKSEPRKAPRTSGGGGGGGAGPRRDVPYARPPPRSTEDQWVHDAYQGQGGRGGGAGRGRGGLPPTAVTGTGVGFTGVSPRIMVVGLHYEVTPADLKTIFSKAGTLVQGPTIRYDRSGRSKGEATMEFASYQQAKAAINQFDGAMTKGQTINIHLLPPHRPSTPPVASLAARINPAAAGGSLLSRIAGGSISAPAERAPRGGGGGRGRGAARGRGGGNAPARGAKKGPATEGDLDKELDGFMQSDKAGDVEMA
ncbi:THO complex subunit 4, partial [Tremellales sp. Uapishka_1]